MQGHSIIDVLTQAERLRGRFGPAAFDEAGRLLARAHVDRDGHAARRWMAVADVLRGSDAADRRVMADGLG